MTDINTLAWLRTIERDTVEVLCSCYLCGHLHTAADQGLTVDVFDGGRKLGLIGQLADHRDGILDRKIY